MEHFLELVLFPDGVRLGQTHQSLASEGLDWPCTIMAMLQALDFSINNMVTLPNTDPMAVLHLWPISAKKDPAPTLCSQPRRNEGLAEAGGHCKGAAPSWLQSLREGDGDWPEASTCPTLPHSSIRDPGSHRVGLCMCTCVCLWQAGCRAMSVWGVCGVCTHVWWLHPTFPYHHPGFF